MGKLENIAKAKLGVHVLQTIFAIVVFCLCIAVMTGPQPSSGQTKWMFALCFLMLPAVIYLTTAPRFPKTKPLAHPYAVAAVDGLFMFFWFTAFIAVAVWNGKGISQGQKDNKDPSKNITGCDVFAFGTPSNCHQSKAAAGLGAFIWVLFIATFAIAMVFALKFRKDGTIVDAFPVVESYIDVEEDTKDAFSTGDDGYALLNRPGHAGGVEEGERPPYEEARPPSYGQDGQHDDSHYEGGNYGRPGRDEEEYDERYSAHGQAEDPHPGYRVPGGGVGYDQDTYARR